MRRRSVLLGCGLTGLGLAMMLVAGVWQQAAAQTAGWVAGDVNGMHYEVLPRENYDPVQRYSVVLYLPT